MSVKDGNKFDTLPWQVKWTVNWYVIVGMFVLCLINLVVELSQAPDTISTGWTIAHTLCAIWWVHQGKKRKRMDDESRSIVL